VGFVVFGCVFAALRAAKTQPNTTNYPPAEQLPFFMYCADLKKRLD
jgi:hypothetical protein